MLTPPGGALPIDVRGAATVQSTEVQRPAGLHVRSRLIQRFLLAFSFPTLPPTCTCLLPMYLSPTDKITPTRVPRWGKMGYTCFIPSIWQAVRDFISDLSKA
ncbi:hypothetical protein V2G26_013865 [Clonostachys chloroleuca]